MVLVTPPGFRRLGPGLDAPGVGQRQEAPWSPPARAGPLRAPAAGSEPSPFVRMMSGVAIEVQRGEALVDGALAATRRGRAFGTLELLALQAGVYRYSEAVDLAAKLIDRASSAVKAVVQGT